jgi:hypothetical protein
MAGEEMDPVSGTGDESVLIRIATKLCRYLIALEVLNSNVIVERGVNYELDRLWLRG